MTGTSSLPADYPAVAAMVALGAVVGRQIAIRPRRLDDWAVVPNLWGGIVGRPGLLKTPALQEACRALTKLEVAAKGFADAASKMSTINTSAREQQTGIQEAGVAMSQIDASANQLQRSAASLSESVNKIAQSRLALEVALERDEELAAI